MMWMKLNAPHLWENGRRVGLDVGLDPRNRISRPCGEIREKLRHASAPGTWKLWPIHILENNPERAHIWGYGLQEENQTPAYFSTCRGSYPQITATYPQNICLDNPCGAVESPICGGIYPGWCEGTASILEQRRRLPQHRQRFGDVQIEECGRRGQQFTRVPD